MHVLARTDNCKKRKVKCLFEVAEHRNGAFLDEFFLSKCYLLSPFYKSKGIVMEICENPVSIHLIKPGLS